LDLVSQLPRVELHWTRNSHLRLPFLPSAFGGLLPRAHPAGLARSPLHPSNLTATIG
jgi:hypothetical protein